MPTLEWWTRDDDVKAADAVPYRLLQPVPELGAGDETSLNMLIQGDNLEALKALLPFYAGQVRCIYIDPPYNTGAAHFEHYDDNLEHAQWLEMMYPRLLLLRNLLSHDGFFCCQIDDSEGPYLKVILDEIFGRTNYLSTLYVQVRYAEKTLKQDMNFHKQIEQVLIYRGSATAKPILPSKKGSFEKFCYYINVDSPSNTITLGGKKVEIFNKGSFEIVEQEGSVDGLKEIWATGTILDGNSSGRFFRDYITGRVAEDGLGSLYRVYGIGDDILPYRYFTGPQRAKATKGKYFQGVPQDKRLEESASVNSPIENYYDFSGAFGNCRHEGGVEFRSGKKPEVLLKLLLDRFSSEGDLILDSFLGSGSTAAVAHKMGRRYIGIEMGEQAQTHCGVRLKNVISGEKSGISEAVGWQGGGGFRFYRLGPPVFDENGQIREGIGFDTLAAHIWFSETRIPWRRPAKRKTVLGVVESGLAIVLLYNGILGDRSVAGGNVLTRATLAVIRQDCPKNFTGPLLVYGERCTLSDATLKRENITFKQTPYDVKARA